MRVIGITRDKEFWESLFYTKKEAKRRKRIRERRSYEGWNELLAFLKTNPSTDKLMKRVWKEIDKRSGFKYATISGYSLESLKLVLEDDKASE